MATTVAYLVQQTRLVSSLRNNQLFDDDQICTLLTDAYHQLRDILIVKFWGWFRKTYSFSLVGGNDGNALDLAVNVPDLEMVKGLDLVDGSGNHFTIDMLDSFANRNVFNTVWPFGGSWSFNGFLGRRYLIDGDLLLINPAANANGNYQLIYTPQAETLALPVTVDFALNAFDSPQVPPPGGLVGNGAWLLTNGGLTAAVPTSGFDLVLNFEAPNTSFSGTYPVTDTQLPPTFSIFACDNLTSTAGFTGPAVGTGTYTYQPVGTIGELPVQLTPWNKYLILYASIAIRTSRRQPSDDLELQFQQISARVSAVTKQRSEGVKQAPITRGSYAGGWGRGGSG